MATKGNALVPKPFPQGRGWYVRFWEQRWRGEDYLKISEARKTPHPRRFLIKKEHFHPLRPSSRRTSLILSEKVIRLRAYTIAVAALALDADIKWLDNLLSHHPVRGVVRKRQGIQRQIPPDSLLLIAVARALIEALSLPIGKALEVADRLIDSPESGAELPLLIVRADVRAIAARLHERLADAVEGAANRPRGRPPGAE